MWRIYRWRKRVRTQKITMKSEDGKTWVVESGDTLGGIAEMCGVSVVDLVRWNKGVIDDPNVIKKKQVINIVAPEDNMEGKTNHELKQMEMKMMGDGRFALCVARVQKHEGGAVDNPNDPGGRTNYGISQLIFKQMREDELTQETDVFKIEWREAQMAYYKYFWVPMRCARLPVGLDYMAFDCAVNMGEGSARKILKSSMGDLHMFNELRVRRYHAIVRDRSASEEFLTGWLKRCREVYAAAKEDCDAAGNN